MKTTLTLEQMKAATVAQIMADVAAQNDKAAIVSELLGTDRTSDVAVTYDDQKRIVKRVETERDLLTGDVLGGRVTTHSYYKSGEIQDIVVSERDAKDAETGGHTIKHFTDGRQPTVSAIKPVLEPIEKVG